MCIEKNVKLEGKDWLITLKDDPTIHIVKGNTKVKETLIFSLPPVRTCPKRTKECEAKCYALKFYRVNFRVRNAWEENFALSLRPDFAKLVIEEIKKIQSKSKKPFKYFRLNDSGDFYNQNYLDSWVEVAKAFPDLLFMAYTKSYHLDFFNLPPNLKIRFSVFPDSKAVRTDLPLAYLDGSDERGKTYHCKKGSTCGECRICWATNLDVKFSLH